MVSVLIGAALAWGASTALALPENVVGFPFKMKAQKTQTDLVPAFACSDLDPRPDCSQSLLVGGGVGGEPAPGNQTKSAKFGNNCTFLSGTVKMQIGKDTQVQLNSVSCGEVLKESGNLCGQTIGYSTLANVDIDKKGVVTEIPECGTPASGDIRGSSNFTTAVVANTIVCGKKGKCKGALSSDDAQGENPCPASDVVSELRRIEIFDGPTIAPVEVLGATLKVCCGHNQEVAPFINVNEFDDCVNAPPQDVLAVPGSLTQGTP
jgi:hypothetical protein